jgi:putative Mg2+ transporter-C (MgtC) family protein
MFEADNLMRYWSAEGISVNLLVFVNIVGALLLGLMVGYERTYHGRAAGMRTYGMVCMASCALTVISGYPQYWFAGQDLGTFATRLVPDPTRVVQGIVTGIGFLGAGVIMKDGLSISGLTTAASLWSSSAIGILVGVGFYSAAILLAALSASLMLWTPKVERMLPARPAIGITLKFRPGYQPHRSDVDNMAKELGYQIAGGSFSVSFANGCHTWRYIAVELSRDVAQPLPSLAERLSQFDGVDEFEISHARN